MGYTSSDHGAGWGSICGGIPPKKRERVLYATEIMAKFSKDGCKGRDCMV
jgi:hypothetical protein